MKMIQLRCPACDAVLNLEEPIGTSCYCMHCGSRILLEDLQDNVIDAKVRMQELEHEKYKIDKEYEDKDKERKASAASAKRIIIVYFILIAIFFVAVAIGTAYENNVIPVPYSSVDFHKMNCEDAVSILEDAGYKNITVQRADTTGLFQEKKVGLVKAISIDGDQFFLSGKKFKPKANIVIIYYD